LGGRHGGCGVRFRAGVLLCLHLLKLGGGNLLLSRPIFLVLGGLQSLLVLEARDLLGIGR